MELYIEKKFIDDFYISLDLERPTQAQQILTTIFKEYGEVDKYIDVEINSTEDLESLKSENKIIGDLFITHPPGGVSSIEEHFFKYSVCDQTIILTQKTENWFEKAEKKGALCFSFDNYEKRIKSILKNISLLNIDIDELPNNWNGFEAAKKLPFNKITICDNYILSDKYNQKMDRNIIPLLKTLLAGKETLSIPIDILTKDFGASPHTSPDQLKKSVKRRHSKLNSIFAKHKTKFRIFNSDFTGNNFDLHAREILGNFFVIRSGRGFNLIPVRQASTETLDAWTIFNKYDYNRINKRNKLYNEYLVYLRKLDTSMFKSYPD